MCVYSGDVCSVGVGVVVVACVVVCVRVYSGDVYTAHIVYHYISVVVGGVCVCVTRVYYLNHFFCWGPQSSILCLLSQSLQ